MYFIFLWTLVLIYAIRYNDYNIYAHERVHTRTVLVYTV